MFKRLLTTLVVFPMSFIIVALLTLILIDIAGGLSPTVQFNFSTINWAPAVVVNSVLNLMSDLMACVHFSLQEIPREHIFVVAFALVGAVIFSLSCVSEHLHVMLLDYRRFFTMPLLFAYAFLILGTLINFAADYIGGNISLMASSAEQKATAIAQYHTDYDSTMHPIVLALTVLAALYLTIRLTRWDGLPWCRAPLPVRVPHQSRRAL